MKRILKGATFLIISFLFCFGCRTEEPDIKPVGSIIEVTDANYHSLLSSDRLIILYFKIFNCRYCNEMEPVIDKLAAKFNCNVIAGKVQVEDNLNSTSQFQVNAFPTTYFLMDGIVVDTIVGSYGLEYVEEIIKKHTGECN